MQRAIKPLLIFKMVANTIQNYDEGDEIYLIGFSRGAFTARSIGGLISSIGLLTRHGLGAFYPIFKDWEHQNDDKFKPEYATNSLPMRL